MRTKGKKRYDIQFLDNNLLGLISMAQNWYQKASVQTAIVSGIFLLIGVAIPYLFKVPHLKYLIQELENSNLEKDSEIQKLETQLVPFKTIALERYTGPENERLNKLANQITTLSADIDALRKYNNVSELNVDGKPFSNSETITVTTPISSILEGTYTHEANTFNFRCDKKSDRKYDEVINKFPNFPFGYYFKAACLRKKNNKNWVSFAEKAIDILKLKFRGWLGQPKPLTFLIKTHN
ncbi:hypothetical protein [Desulfogranum marinum]|uniref:hypothetical protein n=1 Tax=Desulfogranum marinum TaxID=453220 RepID=UPI001966247B|nr:hypothetical protein [Desulfogranum marinum]MBM9514591.1 hypothetical protein [Desulfogranum marinum]